MESKPIVKKILRSPNLKRKSKTIPITQRVTLEKVLGLTISKNAGLACDHNTGTIAYPAGCVIVLFNPRKNKQSHIFNSSKKTLTTVAFSGDGRHLVSGESGHQPAVRVWDVEEKTQVAQFLGHKFGINCVVFSPNLKYIVSVGSQHDMMVNVWNWKTNSKVKSNKVSSKVNAVAFSEDGSYFVTVGNRHVKFWYLENQKSKVNETVPLLGRNGILEDQKNNFFCDVACGRGSTAGSTFCITQSGLLCELDSKRYLSKWVELRTTSANCISVGEDHIFIGCSGGIVRVFSCNSLHFVTTLPKPHALGVDISAATSPSHMVSNKENAKFPDTIALVTDITNKKITCVYNDHSLYIWDVRDLNKVGKAWSFLFHSSCIWGIETYPRLSEGHTPFLPPGSFLTCSSDDTIRVWNLNPHMTENTSYKHNIYSHEVLKILYVDPTFANLCDVNYNPAGTKDKTDTNYDGKNGVRAIKVSPDGQHLASGDRLGNIRVHDLQFMEEISIVEAHDGEVLSLEFSNFPSGPRLLASTSRDRLVHVFDVEQDYGLIQTLDDHSSSISAVKFTETDHTLKMLSCGADKSLLFRNAVLSPSFQFSLSHHLVGKTTLYDMDIDPTHKFVATACQDRNIRIYNIKTAKQKKCYKGSIGDDGVVTKVHLDPSGSFAATSSTDKNLCILDFYTGEFLASMFGHSEIATGVKFTNDLKHLITTGAEGCIFVWRLSSDFTKQMRSRLEELGRMPKELSTSTENEIRRGSFIMPKPIVFDQTDANELFPVFKDSDFKSPEKVLDALGRIDEIPSRDVKSGPNAPTPGVDYRFSVGSLPKWAKPMSADQSSKNGDSSLVGQPRGKWAERVDSQAITVKSMLDGEKTIELAKDATNDRRFTYEADALRRETMIISKPETPPVNLPIITADDENNLEDDDDFLPLSFGPRNLDRSGDFDRSINLSRGSDPPGLNHKWTSRRSLLVDGDDADDEETDSDTREVIYYPQGDADPSDNNFNSYKVFAISCDELKAGRNKLRRSTVGSEGSIRDADSESTDPLSLDDVEEESDEVPSLPTTPLEPERDFTPTKSRFIHDNIENFTPIAQDKFTHNLDNIERQLFEEDSRRIFSPRLSISAKFLNRAGGARNVARQDTWFDSVQKRKDDMARAVDETRRKLESLGWGGDRADHTHLDHPPERGAKLSLAPDTYYSLPRLKKTQFNAESSNQSKMSEPRKVTPSSPVRSVSLGKADAGDKSCVSTFELRPKSISEEPTKPPKPSGFSSKTAQNESSSFMSRKGTSEKNIPNEVAAETEKTRLYTRRHSNEQHSYLRPTKSSRAKIARAASSSNLHRDRTSSTDDLPHLANSSSMENLSFQDMDDAPVANFDNFRHSLSRQKTVSVPNLATCFEEEEEEETSNLCNLIDLSKSVPDFMDADETSSSYSDSSSLAVSEPAVIALNRSAYSSRAMRDSSRKVNQWNTRRSLPGDLAGSKPNWAKPPRSREDFDRFIMPPPSKTQVARTGFLRKAAQSKRRSAPDLTLEQAKNILLGNSGILGKSSLSEYRPSKSNSSRSKQKDTIAEYPESGTVSNLKQQFSSSKSNLSSRATSGVNLSLTTNSCNTSDHKGASGDRLTSRAELDASPLEPPVRDQPSKPSTQSSRNAVKGPDTSSVSPPTKDTPSSQKELVNGGVGLGSKASARLPAVGKSSSAGNVPQGQNVKVNSTTSTSKLRPIDLDVHRRPDKDIANISDIATDLSPTSLSSGDTGSVGTASSTSPRDLSFPKQSTPVTGGASLSMSQSFTNQQGKPATPVTKASGVSPSPSGGILRKAMMFGQTRDLNSNSNPKQLRSASMDRNIDDSCSEFDEISALTVTPSKLRSSQGGVVLPWQVNGRPQQAQSDSGVSSDTDESEPKRPPRRLPVSTMVNNRSANQVSTLKPELSSKPKMSLPSVPVGATSTSQMPNGQTGQRRGSAPGGTHLAPSVTVPAAKDSPSQRPDHRVMPDNRPDKSQLKLPVRNSEVTSTKKHEDTMSDPKDCDQAILDMRKAVKKVKHLYEKVAESRDPESRKMAETLSASLNDIQQTLAEMSARSPDIAAKTFKPITPTPEDDMLTNRSVTPVDSSAYNMLQPILEHYSSHLSEKVFSLIQRRLDSSTPSSSSDA